MPRSGVTYRGELEERLAAQWAGYKYSTEFKELDGDEQAAVIASYRASNQIEAVLNHQASKVKKPAKPM